MINFPKLFVGIPSEYYGMRKLSNKAVIRFYLFLEYSKGHPTNSFFYICSEFTKTSSTDTFLN